MKYTVNGVLLMMLALMCIIVMVAAKHTTDATHQQSLHASATKLTDKIKAATKSTNGGKTTVTTKTKTVTTTTTKDAPPSPKAPYEAAYETDGWGAIHLRHRTTVTTRSQRIAQLQAHQTSLVHQRTKHATVTKATAEETAHGTAKHASHKKKKHATNARRSRHHAARTRALAKLAAHVAVTDDATSSAVTTSDEVVLTNLDDIEYEATVTLGTPPQSFTVIVDTGSTDLWLPSSDCESDGCNGVQTFAWSESSTFINLDTNITESFGSGTLTGYLATDTFGIGNITLEKQTVALIESEDIDTSGFDGLMGMAFEALSDTGASPVFDNMMIQKLLSENKFSMYLSRTTAVDSAIVFGTPRASLYTGDITYIEVSKQVYWQVTMVDIKVNGVNLGVCPDEGCQAVIDSGTSLLTASYDGIIPLMNAVNAQTDCSNLSTLPSIVYVLADQYGFYEFALNSENYMLAESDGDQVQCVAGYMAYDLEDTSGLPIWILGDLFFHQYYMVFDRGDTTTSTARIGFATAT